MFMTSEKVKICKVCGCPENSEEFCCYFVDEDDPKQPHVFANL